MKGTYCLLVELPVRKTMHIGSLGDFMLDEGAYVYVGSAMGGIEQRVRRHKASTKKLRWHIDYLLKQSEVMATICVPSSSKDTECSVARAVLACPGAIAPVPGFGSSDCDCESHLVHFPGLGIDEVAEIVGARLCMLPPPELRP